jgi:hypothetical protein
VAPVGTPVAIIEKLNGEVNKALKRAEVAKKLEDEAARRSAARRSNSRNSSVPNMRNGALRCATRTSSSTDLG